MAERVTKVTLTAQVAGYIAGMDSAAKKTRDTATAAEKLSQQAEGFKELGRVSLAFGTIAAVGVGLAVKRFADFDQAMSNVRAATHESAQGMAALRDAALEAGGRTVFSATEAAGAIEALSKAGVSTADILGGALDGALDLAAAGGLEVGQAAEIAANALNQFNLEGSETARVADLFAAGAGKASGDVDDLAEAMNQVGQVANGTGLSIDETTTALAAFASQGLQGSDAGTSFKTMLGALTPNSAKAADEMERLGISAFNAAGQFVGLEAFAGNLQSSLSGLTDEQRQASLEIIFGQDAVRAATALYNEGAEGIAEWTDKVTEQGYAAETARLRLDNLNGDLEKLGGAFDTVLIKSGSGANAVLRNLTQSATGVVDAVGNLPEPVLGLGIGLTALVSGIALVGGAALVAVPKIAEFRTAMTNLNVSGGAVARGLTGVTSALAVAGAAFAIWAQRQGEVAAAARDFEASLDQTTGAVTEYTRVLVAQKLAEKGAFDAAKDAGISQRELVDAVVEGGEKLESVSGKIAANNNFGNFFTGVGVRAGDAGRAIDDLRSGLERSEENFDNQAAAAEGSVESTDAAAEAYSNAAEQASQLESNLRELIDTVNEANGVGQDAISQNIAYKDALAQVDAAIAEGKIGLDENTEAGRVNMGMLVDLAARSQSAAEAQFNLDGNTANYRSTLEAGRQAVIDRAQQLGYTAEEAQNLADKIYAIPPERTFDMIANTAAAQSAIDRFIFSNNGRTITLQTQVVGVRSSVGNGRPGGFGFADGGQVPHLSGGSPTWWRDGVVKGPGGPRDDLVSAMLSPGEFVVNAASTAKNLGLLHAINSGSDFRYAQPASSGGPVSVSLEGARIVMEVDGQAVTGIIRRQSAAVVDGYEKSRQRRGTLSFGGTY